ncbi:MAG TPA: dihydroneopterin aldolase [Dehalococcoidia bacterium]|nr:dihydroneopterin aldolase [Dehalococcoidia bacterium]
MDHPDLGRLDRIAVEGVVFYGFHGVNAAEKELGQRFRLDLDVWADLAPAGETDDLARTVNYAALVKTARAIVEGEPCNLLETVATRIARAVLSTFPVAAVRVRLTKLSPPIKGTTAGTAAVEIVRYRGV